MLTGVIVTSLLGNWRLLHWEEFHAWSCISCQNPVAGEIIGPGVEPALVFYTHRPKLFSTQRASFFNDTALVCFPSANGWPTQHLFGSRRPMVPFPFQTFWYICGTESQKPVGLKECEVSMNSSSRVFLMPYILESLGPDWLGID